MKKIILILLVAFSINAHAFVGILETAKTLPSSTYDLGISVAASAMNENRGPNDPLQWKYSLGALGRWGLGVFDFMDIAIEGGHVSYSTSVTFDTEFGLDRKYLGNTVDISFSVGFGYFGYGRDINSGESNDMFIFLDITSWQIPMLLNISRDFYYKDIKFYIGAALSLIYYRMKSVNIDLGGDNYSSYSGNMISETESSLQEMNMYPGAGQNLTHIKLSFGFKPSFLKLTSFYGDVAIPLGSETNQVSGWIIAGGIKIDLEPVSALQTEDF